MNTLSARGSEDPWGHRSEFDELSTECKIERYPYYSVEAGVEPVRCLAVAIEGNFNCMASETGW